MSGMWVGILLVAVAFNWGAMGYSHVAPRAACWSMNPGHGYRSQTAASPFRILVPANYRPGQEIEVGINSTGTSKFRGFLLEARTSAGDTVGTFRASHNMTQSYCTNNEALCHNSSRLKSLIKGHWRAPTNGVGTIVFKATVVQSYSRYWTGLTSSQVTQQN